MTTGPSLDKPSARAVETPAIDITAIAMGIGFAFMWSSAFTSAKVALADAPPLLLLTVRFVISGLIAMGIGAALGQKPPRQLAQWGMLALLGICQNSLYLGLFFVAMTTVPAGLASIIASALPLMVAAASALFASERLGRAAMLGLALGFGGVIVIMANRPAGDLDPLGLGLCLIGVTALSIATLVVRHANMGGGLMMIVGIQMMMGAITLAPFGLALESFTTVTITTSLILAFTYTTLVPGVIATWLWFVLIRRIGAPRASAYHFLNPGFGVAVAWIVLGEPIGPVEIAGVAVVAIGILLVQRSRAG